MNWRSVIHMIATLVAYVGGLMVVPAIIAAARGEQELGAFVGAAAVAVVVGVGLRYFVRTEGRIGRKECFIIVALGWTVAGLVGSLPFWLGGTFASFGDAAFESISGLTTTGATLLADIEAQSMSILFWRSLLQWLGGMGIIVLFITVLPNMGVGGARLFMAEVPGPVPERLVPRIQDTAKTLWMIYVGITGLQVLLLLAGGMTLFEAVTHAFTTMATGGFSTRNASIAEFSPFIQMTIMVFAFIAGGSFALYFRVLRGKPLLALRDTEFKFYLLLVVSATATLAVSLIRAGTFGWGESIRHGAFQAVSIMTTTGFVTADYDLWPHFTRCLLFLLMFVGGCAGSTGGSIKVGRVLIVIKEVYREVYRFLNPRTVTVAKLNGRPVRDDVLGGVLTFVFLYVAIYLAATLALTGFGLDLVSSGGAVAATLGNVGPGLGVVGPVFTYEAVPALARVILMACMLLGRLELFTVLVLFVPDFWRKY